MLCRTQQQNISTVHSFRISDRDPERLSTGFNLVFTRKHESGMKSSQIVTNPEFMDPESKVETLHPNTLNPKHFIRVNRSKYAKPPFLFDFLG